MKKINCSPVENKTTTIKKNKKKTQDQGSYESEKKSLAKKKSIFWDFNLFKFMNWMKNLTKIGCL